MSKKDNLDINFEDFDLTEDSSYKELERITRPEIQPLGLDIAVKHGDKYLLKDLALLTEEEMVEWIKQVFPVVDRKELISSDFTGRQQKAQAFDQILSFWSNPIFPKPDKVTKEK